MSEFDYPPTAGYEIAEKSLKTLPSISAERVVRCKDCVHAYYADNRVPHEQTWVCERFANEEITENDFCSWAKMKGGNE